MSEKPLHGMEVDAGFEQMSRKTVTQHVDAAGLLEFGPALGGAVGFLDARGPHRTSSVATRKEEEPAWPYATPVVTKLFEQLRREQRQSILGSLALIDSDQHAFRVNVSRSKPDDFAHAKTRRVGREELCSMFEERCTCQKPRHFFSTQYVWKLAGLTCHRDFEVWTGMIECLVIQEAQSSGRDVTGTRCALFVAMEEEVIGVNY